MKVMVAVPTLGERRLAPLLTRLRGEVVAARAAGHDCRALIVHNARRDVDLETACGAAGHSYVSHDAPGFSEARNRILDEARRASAELLAMIDDDVLPQSGWLTELIDRMQRWEADVAAGPVVPKFPPESPDWIARANLPPRMTLSKEGPTQAEIASGNCLIRLDAVRGHRFEGRFNLSGGEDSAFFRALRGSGATIVWVPSAEVAEEVGVSQLRASYYVRRAYRQGRVAARLRRAFAAFPSDRPVIVEVLRRSAKGLCLLVASFIRADRAFLLRAGWEAAFAAGLAIGRLRRA